MIATRVNPWPVFAADEIEAATAVLQSGRVNYWTGGEGRAFEEEFAAFCGTKHAIAMANGSVTIQAAVYCLDLAPGDEVITTPRTFVASTSSCFLEGLKPVFADVDRDSGNITAETIEKLITPRTRLIAPVHLGGWPCDMASIMKLAESCGAIVMEDCAQAHGAMIGDRSVGSFGHVNSWSFCQDKIMTLGGEGGMITLDDDELWSKIWAYKDHGKSFDAVYNRPHPPGFRWLHEGWGTNYRLTELQSAIGRRQLQKLPEWHAQRTRNAHILRDRLSDCKAVRIPEPPPGYSHAYYKFYTYVRPETLKSDWSRDRIMAEISDSGVPAYSGSCSEIYLEKAFDGTGLRPEKRLPAAQELGETSLMFLVHPTLDEGFMHEYADKIRAVLQASMR